MKATFSKKNLMAALVPAAGISQTQNTYAPCDGLLFECPPDKRFGDYDLGNPDLCRISAFDFEKGLRTTIECKVHEKGMCVISTQAILQIVRALPDGEIIMTIDEAGAAVISGGKVNFRTSASPGETFPSMPMFIGTNVYEIPQSGLRRLLVGTVFAIAQNDLQRTGFNGGLFRIRRGELTVVGCDNYKLAASRCPVSSPEGIPEDAEFILPGKFLRELLRLLNDSDAETTMILGRKHVIFRLNGLYFFTRILETEYPDFEKMLPRTHTTQVFLGRAEFLEAIERASVIAEARLGGIGGNYVKLEFAGPSAAVSSVSSGGAVDEILTADRTGAELTIGFECRNLLETLKACPADCDLLRLRMNSPLMGITIEAADRASFFHTSASPDTVEEPDLEGNFASENAMGMSQFMFFVLPTRMNVPTR